MKEIEKGILLALKRNARTSIKSLATALNLSEQQVAEAILSFEEKGVICGYCAQIDWDAIGEENVTAMIEVKVTPQRGIGFDHIAKRIYSFSEVDAVYLMSGGFDLMILMDGKSMRDISRFVFEKLSTIEFVSSTATHFVLKKYKDNGIVFGQKEEDRRIQGDL